MEGLQDRSGPLQRGVVRQAWNIAKQPPGEKRAALRSYPGSKRGERIEETSHSPWIAIAVFYNTEEIQCRRRGRGNCIKAGAADYNGRGLIRCCGADDIMGGGG